MSGGAITPQTVSFLIAGRLRSVRSRGQNAGRAEADIPSDAGRRSLAHRGEPARDKSQLFQIQYPFY